MHYELYYRMTSVIFIYSFLSVWIKVLLGLDHVAADGWQPHHHPCGHYLLQRRAHTAMDRFQRGLRYVLPHGPGPQLQDRHSQRRQHWNHPGSPADQNQVLAELVCGRFHILHPCGLHFSNSGDPHWLGFLQDSTCFTDCTLYKDPQLATTSAAVSTHSIYPPVGRGRKDHLIVLSFLFNYCPRFRLVIKC